MSYVIQSSSTAAAHGPARRWAANLRSALGALLHELAGAWRCAAARRGFNCLDDNALRDLGITRGEFDSYWAETHGLAEPTRVRVTRRGRASGP
jgi:uncharacterized protein YjiS (DUF1127 family)